MAAAPMPAEVGIKVEEPRKLLPIKDKTELWSMSKTELERHAKEVGIKVEGYGGTHELLQPEPSAARSSRSR